MDSSDGVAVCSITDIFLMNGRQGCDKDNSGAGEGRGFLGFYLSLVRVGEDLMFFRTAFLSGGGAEMSGTDSCLRGVGEKDRRLSLLLK